MSKNDLDPANNPMKMNLPFVKTGSAASLSHQNEDHLESRNKTFTKFLSGFKRFQETYFSQGGLFETLKKGQSPKTLVISCCDSRVDPAIITGCDPGDIFVVRNVANLVAPYQPDYKFHGVSAALEFSVKSLNVEFIIVLGHSQCGGIGKLMYFIPYNDREDEVDDSSEFLGPWMSIAKAPKERTLKYYGDQQKHIQLRACELASILNSIENLLTYPWIRERCENGSLSLCGWFFDFEAGDILSYNPEKMMFEKMDASKKS